MTTITMRKASDAETRAIMLVTSPTAKPATAAYKEAKKLLDAKGWTKDEMSAFVAGGKPKKASTVSGVLQNALDKEEKRKSELSKAVKDLKAKAEKDARIHGTGKLGDEFREGDDDLPGGACYREDEPEAVTELEVPAVTNEELTKALEIIARANKQQAEAIRKAAAERKKVAPEGPKIKTAKPLTPAQIEKARKAEEAAATYLIAASAAIGFVGKGLIKSKEMQVALGLLSLPALRWLAKKYELKIPSDKKSALLIREFLRVELLTFKPKTEVKS